ncbi:N-terminal nucleophile aminohydrolase [Wilcoxina mikolae CBS 423.85]|nr:N-terminal nucleophile aminohydrolase [Wilcoxina mikolae CBS 423.85]
MAHQPRIIVHGGAGSISRKNLPPGSAAYNSYITFLRNVLITGYIDLFNGASALDAACYVVKLFEDNPLFNCGRGSVFTRDGKNELEASVMVTRGRGSEKRGVGVTLLRRVKNPILLAKELLVRGDETKHNYLSGDEAERLAESWGLEIVDDSWFWTERRWKEHLRGLENELRGEDHEEEMEEYLPQGTVGCIVMDRQGSICVATSTGGMTNKLTGRVGDTPTLGAGFWAEEWEVPREIERPIPNASPLMKGLEYFLPECFPIQSTSAQLEKYPSTKTRAIALSGTGNGEYFLRLVAAHNVAARCRFGNHAMKAAVKEVIGEGGEMQKAAESIGRWGTGEGEGGFIAMNEKGEVAFDLNCGGMFRGYIDDQGTTKVAVYRDEELY